MESTEPQVTTPNSQLLPLILIKSSPSKKLTFNDFPYEVRENIFKLCIPPGGYQPLLDILPRGSAAHQHLEFYSYKISTVLLNWENKWDLTYLGPYLMEAVRSLDVTVDILAKTRSGHYPCRARDTPEVRLVETGIAKSASLAVQVREIRLRYVDDAKDSSDLNKLECSEGVLRFMTDFPRWLAAFKGLKKVTVEFPVVARFDSRVWPLHEHYKRIKFHLQKLNEMARIMNSDIGYDHDTIFHKESSRFDRKPVIFENSEGGVLSWTKVLEEQDWNFHYREVRLGETEDGFTLVDTKDDKE